MQFLKGSSQRKINGCPIERSAEIVKEVLDNFRSEIIEEVILVLFGKEDYLVYKKMF